MSQPSFYVAKASYRHIRGVIYLRNYHSHEYGKNKMLANKRRPTVQVCYSITNDLYYYLHPLLETRQQGAALQNVTTIIEYCFSIIYNLFAVYVLLISSALLHSSDL